jgi:trk system potassium uptake protein TrkH
VNLLLDLEILGWLLVGLAGLQLVPAGCAGLFGEPWSPYAQSAAVALAFGLPLALSARGADRRLRTRDAFVVVSGAWGLASLFGALPYVFAGVLALPDALFEAASGFTTTGSTVIADVEAVPHGLLLWRALTQWLGGMGIIVFALAVLPLLGIGGMQLFKAEVPGPVTDKLTPRIAGTAQRLWAVYVGFTLVCGVALWLAGMDPFDALCHAFTTLATGGFSTRNASIGAFSPAAQWVVVVFMTLAGINFVLHWRWLSGRPAAALRDAELRFFLALAGIFVAGVAWSLSADAREEVLRPAVFQVVSLLTTTGFGTDDYERWPAFAQLLVLPLLLLGGMAGSTAGGLKAMRLLLGLLGLRSSLARTVHPHAVRTIRFNGRPLSEEVVNGVGIFVLAYLATTFLGALAVAAGGYDVVTALTASLTAVSNVGPGLGEVGPTETFAHMPAAVKLVLALCMIAGRLEILTLLVVFTPAFWRR